MGKSEQTALREQRLAAKLRENLKRRKEQAKARIEAEIRRMDEYGRLAMFRQMQAAGKLSVEDEMNLNAAHKEILSRKIYMWEQANKENQGAFSSTIARLQLEMKKTRRAISSSVEAMHGQGVALEHVISRLRDVADMIDETQAKAARQTAQEIRRLGTIVAMSSFLIIPIHNREHYDLSNYFTVVTTSSSKQLRTKPGFQYERKLASLCSNC